MLTRGILSIWRCNHAASRILGHEVFNDGGLISMDVVVRNRLRFISPRIRLRLLNHRLRLTNPITILLHYQLL
jgi:hypothetical protein